MDPSSLAVFTTLGINILGTFLIFIGWLLIRKKRGDKKMVKLTTSTNDDPRLRESLKGSEISYEFNGIPG